MDKYSINLADRRLDIYRFIYQPVESNMFFIPVGDEGIVFDPNVSESILPLFDQYGTKRLQVILTHEHYDHTTGVEWLRRIKDCDVFCQKDCAKAIAMDSNNDPRFVTLVLRTKDCADGGHRYEDFMAEYVHYTLQADSTFDSESQLNINGLIVNCHSTPGHSPGSSCFIIEGKCIFTGDSLIQNTPTITRFKTSNKSLFESYTLPFLRMLDKNIMVFPGHGVPFKITDAKYL